MLAIALPHGHACLLDNAGLIWTFAIGNVVVGIAYFSIPLTLYLAAKRIVPMIKDLSFVYWFVAFIALCGFGHFVDTVTLWYPIYLFSAVVRTATALVSIYTAFLIVPAIAVVLKLYDENTELRAKSEKNSRQIQALLEEFVED